MQPFRLSRPSLEDRRELNSISRKYVLGPCLNVVLTADDDDLHDSTRLAHENTFSRTLKNQN